ncbi:kinase-like domain-containing protein [Rhizophagus clarus]|uniref:Kinase-like domain-containing protein n=1 Tax=Rhizophagus clarus TaxID=94130 RepID=A0A8H3KWG4_9GLOM|nr:kinase-like domain-containing protein [Rhizophagus clarus]
MKTFSPDGISEWIPYNNLKNTKYLTKGGFSEIYTATWTNGRYEEWDPKEQQLKRIGEQMVVLKKLENFENANQSWLEEARSHLTISNKWPEVVQCYGLTQEPSNESYMLVMSKLDIDLRKCDISDLGFCGPADKPLKSICGNLPYLAPEVIIGKGHTFKSDIYSIAMLMWEISSGQPSFINYEHDYYLAMNIVNGIRPKFVSGTPLEYKNLMKQFWDADPLKRPDIFALMDKINEINLSYLKSNESLIQQEENNSFEITEDHTSSSKLSTSKLHYFENLPEPRNATEEEQEAFHSNKSYNFHVPNNIDDFNKLSSKKNSMGSIFKDIKNDNKIEAIQQQTKKYHNIRDNDEDEIFNNPNLHSEEQDELVLPDNI